MIILHTLLLLPSLFLFKQGRRFSSVFSRQSYYVPHFLINSFLSNPYSHNFSTSSLVSLSLLYSQSFSQYSSRPFSQHVHTTESLLCWIFFDTSVTFILFLITSFLILSNLVTPQLHLNILISATSIF
ncbi:hypothetical protein WDU94_010303, partial [Cyamophila willieti]